MYLRSQLFCITVGAVFIMLFAYTWAEMARDDSDNSFNALYENLLQREYAEPAVFPQHEVERKAVRSPSLRLRFGRRSDNDIMSHTAEKRWFGDVNQKPIRSPSLRLRFGRRSDPSMPLLSPLDMLMNAHVTQQNFNNDDASDYNDLINNYYERMTRKPQRLRFGRSVPSLTIAPNHAENNFEDLPNINEANNELFNIVMHSPRLRNLIMALAEYENFQNLASALDNNENVLADEFDRDIRKPARLRFGRSTPYKNTNVKENVNKLNLETVQDTHSSPILNQVNKEVEQKNQNQNQNQN